MDYANLITKYKLANRFAEIDQLNVEEVLKDLEEDGNSFYRPCTSTVEDIEVPTRTQDDEIDVDEEIEEEAIEKHTIPGDKLLFVYQVHNDNI